MTQSQRSSSPDSGLRAGDATPARPARLATIQAGRGIAALAVVLFHANVVILPLQLYHGTHGPRLFDIGYAGVEFFFVLSGFIIFIVHRNDFSRPAAACRFLTKRFLRIYPIYWLVMAFVFAAHPLVHSIGGNPLDYGRALRSLALLPTNGFPVLAVAWTLEHEVMFYAAFIFLIVNVRIGGALFAAWGLACTAGMLPVLHAYTHPFPSHFLLSPFNLLFSLGMLSAIAAERLKPSWAGFVFCIGLAGFLAAPLTEVYKLLHWNSGAMTLCEGLGAAMAVAGLAAGERKRGWFVPLALVFLGDASYSIYLVHLPAMKLAAPLMRAVGLPGAVPALLMLALCTAIALAAGIALHLYAERPLLKLAGRPARRNIVDRLPARCDRQLPSTDARFHPVARRRRVLGRMPGRAQKPSFIGGRARRFRGLRL